LTWLLIVTLRKTEYEKCILERRILETRRIHRVI